MGAPLHLAGAASPPGRPTDPRVASAEAPAPQSGVVDVKPLTHSASYPDRETAQWCTQEVVTRNEQVIHRWLAQGTRQRLTIEAAWPSKPPVGRVLLQAMMLAGRDAVDAHAARVVLTRDPGQANGFRVLSTFPIYL